MSLLDIFKKEERTGLVLGGGGVRGFFHMGVIKALRELKVEINEISGTSIGALVAAIYAADPDVDFEKLIDELDYLKISQIIASAFDSKGSERLERFLKNYMKVNNFNEFKIPIRFNAVDINNYREVVFEEGEIFPGIIASMSIPGVFPVVEYNKSYLVDGGVLNNVPVNNLKNCQRIIISDITGPIKKIDGKTNKMDVLYSSIAIMQKYHAVETLKASKEIRSKQLICVTLEDNETNILDLRITNFKKLFDMGYKSMMSKQMEL
ncbi:MAG TPA: patatin-like phospholipase family protein [Patescibacteria group bacterium]